MGVAAPFVLLVLTVLHHVDAMYDRSQAHPRVGEWMDWTVSRMTLGLACAPALTMLAPGVFNRTAKAILWTSWAGMCVGGLAAILAG